MWGWMRRAPVVARVVKQVGARFERSFERVYSADEVEVALRAAFRQGADFGATFQAQSENEERVGLVLVRAVTSNPGFMRRALSSVREGLGELLAREASVGRRPGRAA